MRTWLYHKTKPARIFDTEKGDDLEKLNAEGWRDNPVEANEVEEDDSGTDSNPPPVSNIPENDENPKLKPAPKAKPAPKPAALAK